ncbi:tetratricopeptide repeat protein [Gracilibacillus caseinilyticus]|uniref:Tetratricopeptide repeat protein n=1 Tax=Gracilibacillus caseinilyticus TaxID=2932256 RepID=A0ABY4F194_9BACI|nr:tetratricopeptide repeat protein [Gracilibacillus caseinilyticus]UOQ49664.1 tetratricopeptide repeat protein [Gracilibacillus caseinilyticus]
MSENYHNQDIVSNKPVNEGNHEDADIIQSIPLQELLHQGYTAFNNNNYGNAQQWFEKAIKQEPHSAEAHAWLAAVYGRQIDAAWSLTDKIELFSKLEKEITLALEIDDTLPLARRMNGSKLLNSPDMLGGDPAEAVKEFCYCIEQGMDDIEIWVSLAKCYVKTAEHAKAKEALNKAYALDPKNEEVLQLWQDANKEEI